MVSINLVPHSLQQTLRCRRHLAVWTVLVLGALAVLTVPLGIGWMRQVEADRLSQQNVLLQSDLSTARAQLRELEASAKDSLLCLERAKALRSKRAWSAIIASIAHKLPAGCWLTKIASDPSVPPPPSKRSDLMLVKADPKEKDTPPPVIMLDSPRKIVLAGYATDPSEPYQFVTSLKQTGVFQDVTMVTSRREPVLDSTYIRFELACDW